MQKIKGCLFSLTAFVFILISDAGYALDTVVESNKSIPFKQDNTDYPQVWFVTVLFVFLALAAAYLVRKYLNLGGKNQYINEKNMVLIESRRLSAKTIMYFVKIESRKIIIVESNDGVKIINVVGGVLEKQPDIE